MNRQGRQERQEIAIFFPLALLASLAVYLLLGIFADLQLSESQVRRRIVPLNG